MSDEGVEILICDVLTKTETGLLRIISVNRTNISKLLNSKEDYVWYRKEHTCTMSESTTNGRITAEFTLENFQMGFKDWTVFFSTALPKMYLHRKKYSK